MPSVTAPARTFSTAILGVVLCASSLLVLLAGPTSTASASAPAPSTSNCQNASPLGMPGTWTCSFDDEFNGTSLDTTKWIPQLSANSGYTTGTTSGWPCYVNNPNTISESGGYLHLSVVQVAAPISCAGYPTSFEAGMVTTDKLFDQTYGAFEVNAELPASTVKGLQETFWLYPQNLTYGAWPDSGEIDFAEFYSQYPTLDVPYIHYSEAASGDPAVTAYNCTINQGQFNTYGIDWQPGTLTIYLNGNVCLVDHPNPAAPLTSPEPFNDPFFLALTQALGSGTDAYVAGTTQLPATTLVNSVRAWTANTNTYGVTYNGNGATAGGAPVDANSYAAGTTVSVLGNTGNLANTGYTFDDWNTAADGGGTSYAPGATLSMPAAGVTLYAIWTTNTYGVSYNGNGATAGGAPADANSYAAGTAVTVLGNTVNLVNTGYSFDDWNTAADGSGTVYAPGATFSMPAAGVTLYAIWTANTYSVTYAGNGASGVGNVPVDAIGYAAGATVSVLGNTGNLVNTGYSFDDWNTAADGSGTSYAPGATFSMPAGGVTLYAIWTANTYGVSYNGNGSTGIGSPPVDANSYAAGATVSALGTGTLSRTGYTFDDWNTAADGSGSSYAPGGTLSMPVCGVTLYAIWTANTYSVTYAGNGASGVGNVPVDANSYAAGATVSVLGNTGNLVNTGYSFDDWNTAADGSGTSYAPGATFSMPAGGVTLYAIWTANTYGVSYNGNGSTGIGSPPVDANSYAAGATVSALGTGTLSRTGYTFDDWNTAADGSGSSYAPGGTLSMPAGGVTLYAIWTPNTYSVTYSGDGATAGSAPADANSPYDYGATVSVLGAGTLTRTGYSFDDWNTAADGSGTSYAPGATFSMPAGGVTLYAIWTPNYYSVIYNGNGATTGGAPADANSPYDYGATVNVLGAGSLSRTGYSFDDWNTAANGAGTSYAPGATFSMPAAGVTLYAIWTANTYGVTYNGNGSTGNVPVDANSYAAGATVNVLGTGTLTRAGYSFDDWNTAANGAGTSYAPGATFSMPAAGVTLYAIWSANVLPEKTTTGLSLSKTSLAYGAETSETLTVTVTGQSGDGSPQGILTVYNSSTKLCSQTLVAKSADSATATCSLTAVELPVGSYNDVFAAYTPSTTSSSNTGYTYTASTSTPASPLSVSKDTTITKVSESPTNVTHSDTAVVFTAAVATHNGEAVPIGEKVTVKVGSAACTVTLNAGTGTCTMAKSALPKGSNSVSATYGGDANLGASSGTSATKLTVMP